MKRQQVQTALSERLRRPRLSRNIDHRRKLAFDNEKSVFRTNRSRVQTRIA
jgi:hypothetical protein